ENTTVRCNTFGTVDTEHAIGAGRVRMNADRGVTIEQNVFAAHTTDSFPLFMIDGIYGGGPKEDVIIQRNFLGTNPAQTHDLISPPDAAIYGVVFSGEAENVLIGSENLADRNVFSGL